MARDLAKADGHLKRLACQLFTQLPDDKEEALRTLRYVRLIVENLDQNWEQMAAKITQLVPTPKGRAGWPEECPAGSRDDPGRANPR